MFKSWVINEIRIIDLSSALVGMWMSSSKLFLFSNKAHLNPDVRLLLELYCVIVIKHVAFFTILFEITSNDGINICLSGCNCGLGYEEKYWRIDGIGGKKARIGGFAYSYATSPLTAGSLHHRRSCQ